MPFTYFSTLPFPLISHVTSVSPVNSDDSSRSEGEISE